MAKNGVGAYIEMGTYPVLYRSFRWGQLLSVLVLVLIAVYHCDVV